MNITNVIAGILAGFIFYFLAIFVITTAGLGLPNILIVLVSILVGILVYKHGVQL